MRSIGKLFLTLFLIVVCGDAAADLRPFAFVKDAYAEGKGTIEYEQYVTWKSHKQDDSSFSRFEFTHEFEFGVAENVDIGVYVANWSYQHSDEGDRTHYDSFAVEGIVYFSNPVTDAIGSGIYVEAGVGEDSLSFEAKLLLQKDIGQWTFAYNLIAETEVEGVFRSDEDNEVEGELAHALGATCAVSPSFRVGGELLVESVFPDWSEYEDTTVYLGPSLAYGAGNFNIILAPLIQLTDVDAEPDFNIRLLATLEF